MEWRDLPSNRRGSAIIAITVSKRTDPSLKSPPPLVWPQKGKQRKKLGNRETCVHKISSIHVVLALMGGPCGSKETPPERGKTWTISTDASVVKK